MYIEKVKWRKPAQDSFGAVYKCEHCGVRWEGVGQGSPESSTGWIRDWKCFACNRDGWHPKDPNRSYPDPSLRMRSAHDAHPNTMLMKAGIVIVTTIIVLGILVPGIGILGCGIGLLALVIMLTTPSLYSNAAE